MTTSTSQSATSRSVGTLTVLGRLRDTPKLWVFAVLMSLMVTASVLQGTGVRTELKGGELGIEMQRRPGALSIGAVATRWADADVRSGDELVAVNDEPVTAENFFEVRTKLAVGPAKIRLMRDGVPLEVVSEVVPLTLVTALAITLRWLTGVLLALLAAGVFVLRPGAKQSWLLTAFLCELGLLVMFMPGLPLPQKVVYLLLGFLFCTVPATSFHFFATIPSELNVKRLVIPLYVSALGLWVGNVVVGNTTLFSVEQKVGAMSVLRIGSVLLALPTVWAVVAQWLSARKKNDPRLLSVARTLTIAAIVGLFVPLLGNTIVRSLGLEGGFAHQVTALSVLIFGITTTVVLVRHNPLEVDRYAASVVGYMVTLGGLGGVFVLALFTLPLILRRVGLADSSEALVGLTALVFFSAGPIYRRLRKSVDKWFSRDQADALQTSEVLRRIADSVQNDSRELALNNIVQAAATIGPELVALWQIDSSGRSLHRLLWRNGKPEMPFVTRLGPIEKVLERGGAVEGLGPVRWPTDSQQALWELELAMASPIRAHGVAMGFLGVGRRPSGFGYRNEDLAFLETLASQAGLALERGEVVKRIGRYRVEKRLAQGGMAEVFIAWQLGPGGFERKVALKRLLPELAEDPRSAAGLLDEARITARLQHPNIAQVFEVGLEAGQHFIAMEFVDGPPVRALISNQRRANMTTPLPVSLAIAEGLLGALDHAHQLKDSSGVALMVVHRDVTPANVLVSTRGEPKLVDFGLVMASTRLFKTQTGVARGTLPYMSPEQAIHADTLDLRADVYSAGATLYELFSGERAFTDGPTGSKPLPLSRANPLLPATLDAVFEQAFTTDPNQRFSSAGTFWKALRAATEPTPIAALSEVASWVTLYKAQGELKSKADIGTRSVTLPPTRNDGVL